MQYVAAAQEQIRADDPISATSRHFWPKFYLTMGRKVKTRSNPALAESHAAGAKVTVCGLLTHATYGAIAYALPTLSDYHHRSAREAAAELVRLHQKVLELQPNKARMRMVPNDVLLHSIYAAGNGLVSHSVRAVQHLAQEIEAFTEVSLQTRTVQERINEAVAMFSQRAYSLDKDYAGLNEINDIRDALEHPQTRKGEYDWGSVPLAWMLSDRSLGAWRRFDDWFTRLTAEWNSYRGQHPKALTVSVARGIESQLPLKKSPRSAR